MIHNIIQKLLFYYQNHIQLQLSIKLKTEEQTKKEIESFVLFLNQQKYHDK